MNERELTKRLEDAMPDVPANFHNAMLGAFAQIQEQEALEQTPAPTEENVPSLPKPRLKKRTAAIILIAALLMAATVAVATTMTPRILAYFWGGEHRHAGEFLEHGGLPARGGDDR